MTTAQQAADRIREALEKYDAATNGRDEARAIGLLMTEATPEALRAILDRMDELAKDAARWRFIRDEAVWRADPDGRGEMLWAVVGTRHDDCTPIDGAELDAACDERIAALTPKD